MSGISYVQRHIKENFQEKFSLLLETYLKILSQYSNLFSDFLDAMEYEKKGMKTNLMLILMKYGTKGNMKEEMNRTWKKLNESEGEINKLILDMKQTEEKGNITCPACNGLGGKLATKYVVDGPIKTPVLSKIPCENCKGEGIINIPEDLKAHLSSYINVAAHFLNLTQSFRQIIQKVNMTSAYGAHSTFNVEALSQDELEIVRLANLLDKKKIHELLRSTREKSISVDKLLSIVKGEAYETKEDLHNKALKIGITSTKKEAKIKTIKRKHVRKGEITPQEDYAIPILEALIEMGGRGKAKYVLRRVYEKMKYKLKPIDLKRLPHSPEKRWVKGVRWERQRLVNEGYVRRDSPPGIWEITDKGRKYYESYREKLKVKQLSVAAQLPRAEKPQPVEAPQPLIITPTQAAQPSSTVPALTELEGEVISLMSSISTLYTRKIALFRLLYLGEVSENTFLKLYDEYNGKLSDLLNIRARRLEDLKIKMDEINRRLNDVTLNIKELNDRYKIGDVDLNAFSQESEKLKIEQKEIESLARSVRANLERLEKILGDKSSNEISDMKNNLQAAYDAIKKMVEKGKAPCEVLNSVKSDVEESISFLESCIRDRKESFSQPKKLFSYFRRGLS